MPRYSRKSSQDIQHFVRALRQVNYPKDEIQRQKRLIYFFVRWLGNRYEDYRLSHERVHAYRVYLRERSARDYEERSQVLAAFLWHLSREKGFDRQAYFYKKGIGLRDA